MTEQLRPSDGRRVKRPAINLNRLNIKAGERVLFDGFYGPRVEVVKAIVDNTVHVGGQAVEVTKVDGRVPAGCDVDALIEALREAEQVRAAAIGRARDEHERTRKRILREHRVR
jgi:hypothetical protein